MRRKDREITDEARINEIIESCECCRLGFCDEGGVYIVPLSFGFEAADGKRFFYFHSAAAGRKIELIRRERRAGFELDTAYEVRAADAACEYTARFQSVIGTGSVDFIEDAGQKARALNRVMRHSAGKDGWSFPEEMLKKTAIFRLTVEEISCKEHK